MATNKGKTYLTYWDEETKKFTSEERTNGLTSWICVRSTPDAAAKAASQHGQRHLEEAAK